MRKEKKSLSKTNRSSTHALRDLPPLLWSFLSACSASQRHANSFFGTSHSKFQGTFRTVFYARCQPVPAVTFPLL